MFIVTCTAGTLSCGGCFGGDDLCDNMAACAAACLPQFYCGGAGPHVWYGENQLDNCSITPSSYLCLNVCADGTILPRY
jgi:hypothetical protein